eukprot:756730-Hanusia_phi.AAC.3
MEGRRDEKMEGDRGGRKGRRQGEEGGKEENRERRRELRREAVASTHLADEILGLVRHAVPVGGGEGEFASCDLLEESRTRAAQEGKEAAEHDVDDDAQGPNVHFLVVARRPCLQHLRRHILRLRGAELGRRVRQQRGGRRESGEGDVEVWAEEGDWEIGRKRWRARKRGGGGGGLREGRGRIVGDVEQILWLYTVCISNLAEEEKGKSRRKMGGLG